MEKTSNTILEEMRQAVAALRSQIDSIEAQMQALELAFGAEAAENEYVASPEIPAETVEEVSAPVAEAAPAVEEEAPVAEAETVPAPEPIPAPEPAPEPEPEPMEMPEPAPAPVEEEMPADTLVMEEAPEPIDLGISDFSFGDVDLGPANINDAEAVNVKPAVMDVMAEKCAWKTDMPGTPVKNVLSAISLNDRILFVKTLFGEDAALFQQTIQLFNTYTTLDEAESYVRTNFRNWDMNSDVVYRFMMAARRKLK